MGTQMPRQNAYLATEKDHLQRLAAMMRSMHPKAQEFFLADVYGRSGLMVTPWWMRTLVNIGSWWSGYEKYFVWKALLADPRCKLLSPCMEGLIEHLLHGVDTSGGPAVVGGFTQEEIDHLALTCHMIDYKHSKGYLT